MPPLAVNVNGDVQHQTPLNPVIPLQKRLLRTTTLLIIAELLQLFVNPQPPTITELKLEPPDEKILLLYPPIIAEL